MSDLNKLKQTLEEYIDSKQELCTRIKQNEEFYRASNSESRSPYLMNALLNKHADIMDSFPEPVVLPKAQDDIESASMLSALLPVIFRQNSYERLYSDSAWEKLKHGTGIQGAFWNGSDIVIKNIDINRIFWQPNIDDIQQSRFVFYISLMNSEDFKAKYPKIKAESTSFLNTEPDNIEIIDCYFKQKGRLELVKFVGDSILYDSSKSPFPVYDHGKYPFVFDRLYSMKNTPIGFGILDIIKRTQRQIDTLDKALLDHAQMSAKKRFFIRVDGGVNEREFANWNNDFVHVAGGIDDSSIRELNINPIDSSCYALLNSKIEELKECSGNRDFNQGSVSAGVTAASAISALQEAGNKLSRDIIRSSYHSFTDLCKLVVELVRQFYSTPKVLRIMGDTMEFRLFSNQNMQAKDGMLPDYDIVIQPQKASPFSTLAQNELAKEFFAMGFFKPENKAEALACISMMNFEGKEAIISRIQSLE